jgi:redox-sensitive bicupin YhaK (pirin superfamily)
MKKPLTIIRNVPPHWVGDGFPVRSLFSYHDLGAAIDPFLLLDYAGPAEFPPADEPRGVGEHPHRGFETVTIVYQGELEHRDSAGNRGRIGPGDVQWMTAASGVVHEEFHSRAFTRSGGTFEVVQLWVNLPAEAKMSPPRYQELTSATIPSASLAGGAGSVRVIAGEFGGTKGPAHTVTPIHLWDLQLAAGHTVNLPAPEGFNAGLLVRRGTLSLGNGQSVTSGEFVAFDRAGAGLAIECHEDAQALMISGEPISESVVGHGPFVMNTSDEIEQAFRDYQTGRMGSLA